MPANCLAHGRRQFVQVAQNFPGECRYVLESLGQVYRHEAEARELGLTPEDYLTFRCDCGQRVSDHKRLAAECHATCRPELRVLWC